MKKLLILSGKGGTGKTTTAAAFIGFSKSKAYADCDVDAPNLHLVVPKSQSKKTTDFFGLDKATINHSICISCGLCQQLCRFNAIKKENDKYTIDLLSCEGCGTCIHFCPEKAISFSPDAVGKLELYKDSTVFSTAELKMGKGNSGKLVSQVKVQLNENIISDTSIAIIDGSPGIGCPVIASISGVDLVLIVTEPTLSGYSDLRRIVKTAEIFKVQIAVCINKFDISPDISKNITNYCRFKGLSYLGNIPFDPEVSKAINNNKNLSEVDCSASKALREIYNKMIELISK